MFPASRRPRRLATFLWFGLLCLPALLQAADPIRPATAPRHDPGPNPPNFLIVLADDLGYGDLACYGHPVIQTPNLDRFAREGLKFTDCYAAAANCSPSRTGLMTGRTPTRVGVHNWIPMNSPMHVRRSEITVASLLRQAGYATAHVGKWHLNGLFNRPGQPQPPDHGFDYWFSTQNNALPNHRNPENFVRNGIPVGRLEGYAGDRVAAEADQWLRSVRDPRKPFFLFVCFHEPHEPIASDPDLEKLYPFPEDPSRRAHHANVTQLDRAFGKLLRTLDDLQLNENTMVLFTSDNGPAITSIHPHGSTGSLRSKKGFLYEGGIRVPGLLRWPGRTRAGSVSHEAISGVDLLPTLCEIAGIEPPRDRILDGTSWLPVLEGKTLDRVNPLYWHFNATRTGPKVALRSGDWKLLATLKGPDTQPYGDIRPPDQEAIKTAELDTFELYNLREDREETTDLAARNPAQVEELASTLRKMYQEVQAETPSWPAWTFDRYESQRIIWPAYRYRKPARK